jgi:C4-dicarboxylate transporter, DctM subunit
MAGFLPGILSILLYIALEVIIPIYRPEWMPRGATFRRKENFNALKGSWQIPLLAVLTLEAIYTGICTPTEAAAVGTFMAIVLGIVVVGFKKLRLRESLHTTTVSAVMIFAILSGALVFSSFMSVSRIPSEVSDSPRGQAHSSNSHGDPLF